MSTLEAVLWFVVLPAAFVLLVVLMVMGPGWTRAGRYRPGEPWNYEPLIINAAATGDVRKALEASPTALVGVVSDEPAPRGEGGASARW